jgi:hypothetical protein
MRSLAAWLSLTVLLVVVAPAGAAAEIQLGGLNLSGEIEAGPVFYLVEPSKSRKAKFEEYRDMTEGLWLHNLSLRLSTPDEGYATELYGSKWGYEDQRFGLTAGRIGVWQFYFEWDQIPKVYSTNSRMLADERGAASSGCRPRDRRWGPTTAPRRSTRSPRAGTRRAWARRSRSRRTWT